MINNPADNPFGSYGQEFESKRSWLSSLTASAGVYIAIAVLAASITATKTIIERKKPVPVKFVEKVVRAPAPLPPAPKPIELKPTPPPKVLDQKQRAPAPAVPKDMKVRKLDKPPPPKELVAPKDMPLDAAPEADASLDQGIAIYGDGSGDAAGLEGGYGSGIPGGIVANPEVLAQALTRPDPPYPDEMLLAGRQGTVILKVIVLADGTIHAAEVVSGDSPFTGAALETVKGKWTFEPGKLKGRNVNTIQTVTVNFKLTTG